MKGFIVVKDMEGATGLLAVRHIVAIVETRDSNVIIHTKGKLSTCEHLGAIIQKIKEAQDG